MRQRPSSYKGSGLEAAAFRGVSGQRRRAALARLRDQREKAAAGAAEGALGLDRPAASGSRWRRNAARQDFSRSAEARRTSGRAAESGDGQATEAIRARTAASMAPARTVPARAVRPDGLAVSWIRSRSSPASMASRLPSIVTMTGPPVGLLLAYAVRQARTRRPA